MGIFLLSFPMRAELEDGRSHSCLTLNPVLWVLDSVTRCWLFADPCRNISVLYYEDSKLKALGFKEQGL